MPRERACKQPFHMGDTIYKQLFLKFKMCRVRLQCTSLTCRSTPLPGCVAENKSLVFLQATMKIDVCVNRATGLGWAYLLVVLATHHQWPY